MKPRTALRLAWSLWGAGMALAALALLFLILGRSTPQPVGTFGFRGFSILFARSEERRVGKECRL